jgi:protein-S-isoprenylcysteine O-methyltransferase
MLNLLIAIWPISEIVLGVVRRGSSRSTTVRDRGSAALLWSVIAVGVTAGFLLQFEESGRMTASPDRRLPLALGLLVAGLAIRWVAILTLGRLFNTTVAIHADHTIVRRGLYRWVRHPSYTGLLLAFIGLGVSFGNWFSLAAVVVPIAAALLYRIRVEERALLDTFGRDYSEYVAATKRLVPWVY